jgi:hypothetical protein
MGSNFSALGGGFVGSVLPTSDGVSSPPPQEQKLIKSSKAADRRILWNISSKTSALTEPNVDVDGILWKKIYRRASPIPLPEMQMEKRGLTDEQESIRKCFSCFSAYAAVR